MMLPPLPPYPTLLTDPNLFVLTLILGAASIASSFFDNGDWNKPA